MVCRIRTRQHQGRPGTGCRQRLRLFRGMAGLALALAVLCPPAPARALTTSALQDQTCAGFRSGGMNCTAGEFTIAPVFSATPGTPPFCVAGQPFSFQVDLGLSGTNTDRYNIGFFVGQQGNDPTATTPGNNCSVATFPNSPSPWANLDGNACGDFIGGGNMTTTVNKIKVICQSDDFGALTIPYVVTYWQNTGGPVCTGPADVTNGSPSKCNKGVSSVSGTVRVYSGAYLDVTKQTAPDGDGQPFSFTATGPAGSKVVALTGATLTPTTATGGTYTPASIEVADNTATVTLSDGQTARFYINALAADQTLTVTEAPAANWESSAAISCAPVAGNPALTPDNASRTVRARLSVANSAAACTITNTKRARVTLVQSLAGRVDAADQFTASASGGGTLTGTPSAATSGSATSASTVLYSTPGSALVLSEAKSAGPTPEANYQNRLTCVNAFSGPGATPAASLPAGLAATTATLVPAPGDDITCTFTRTPKALLSKGFSPGSIAAGGSSTLSFTVTNPAGAPARSGGIAFTDTLPAGMTIAAVPGVVNGCGGSPTVTAVPGSGSFSVAGGGVNAAAGPSSCSISVKVTAAAPGSYLNGAGQIGAYPDTLLNAVTDQTLRVYAPPTVAKGFGAAAIPSGSSTALTLTLANPAANPGSLTGVRVDDLFPAGLSLYNTGFTFTPAGCGSITRTGGAPSAAGDTSLRFSAGSLAPGGSCQATVNVTSATPGAVTNTTASPVAGGPATVTGASASAGLSVSSLPLVSILKSADRGNANPGQVVVYTVQIVNSGTSAAASVVLTDSLSPYTALFLGAGAPFSFTDSTPASGLTPGTLQYSNNNGANWGYAPVSGGGGAPAGYDGNVTNWRIPMSGTLRPGGSYRLDYRVVVE